MGGGLQSDRVQHSAARDERPGPRRVHAEFLDRDAALGLEAYVDDRKVLLDPDDLALDDIAFRQFVGPQALVQHRGEIVACGVHFMAAGHLCCCAQA